MEEEQTITIPFKDYKDLSDYCLDTTIKLGNSMADYEALLGKYNILALAYNKTIKPKTLTKNKNEHIGFGQRKE